MSLTGFLILALIAMIAGSIGQMLAGYSLGGCLISSVVGFIGAYLGQWIAREFDLPLFLSVTVDGETFPIIWAIIGSAILAAVIGMFTRRR